MGINLDINTPRGQVSLMKEAEMTALFKSKYPKTEYISTDKKGTSGCDGLLISGADLIGVVETKCRWGIDLTTFASIYHSEWLVTFEKIIKCRSIADSLQTDLWGFLYLVDVKCLLMKKLWSPTLGWTASMRIEKTQTQATINGGKANRDNAYIDLSKAEIIFHENS